MNALSRGILCTLLAVLVSAPSVFGTGKAAASEDKRGAAVRNAMNFPGRAAGQAVPAGHPRGRALGRYQRESLERLTLGAMRHVDSLRVIVLRASFSDLEFKDGPEYDEPHDSLYYANEIRHLDEYYIGASNELFHMSLDLAPGIVELSRPMGYYGMEGHWDERVVEMLMEVVAETDSAIDFSPYDAFAIIHAGPGQETDFEGNSPDQIWSGFIDPIEMEEILADTLGTPGVPTNDTIGSDTFYVDNLMVWPEEASQDGRIFGALGIYAYQVGMRIGMIPLFDTTPSGFPDSQGIGSFGLMGYGLYNAAGFIPAFPCAFHRYLMGWSKLVIADSDASLSVGDINDASTSDTTLVKIPVKGSEYFLLANRIHDTNFNGRFDFIDLNGNGIPENEDTLLGAEFDFFLTATTNPSVEEEEPGGGTVKKTLTGSGLMIWHIDENIIIEALRNGDYPQDDAARKGVDLEEADGIQDLDSPIGSYSFGSYLDSYREGNNTSFGPATAPWSRSNSGVSTWITVDGISEAAPVMSFDLSYERSYNMVMEECRGSVTGLSPIPCDTDGAGSEELIMAATLYDTSGADTGLVHIVPDTDGSTFMIEQMFEVPGAAWSSSPILEDIDRDDIFEVFITSTRPSLHAYKLSGIPYPIDDDATPGDLGLRGDLASAPMLVEADGDASPEVLVLSCTEDSTYAYLIDCGTPISGGVVIGNGVIEVPLCAGRLLSHTAWGKVTYAGDGFTVFLEGFFVMTIENGNAAKAHYIPLLANDNPIGSLDLMTAGVSSSGAAEHLLTISSGDVDGDGTDEMVAALPSSGIVYYRPRRGVRYGLATGARPSPPVLWDVNGDGVLETALRDEARLYLLTGDGVLMSNWPLRLPAAAAESEQGDYPPPPVIGDVDGDGDQDIVFGAGGDLYAYGLTGGLLGDWPLAGEGIGPQSPALLTWDGDRIFIFMAASTDRIRFGDGNPGIHAEPGISALRRYDTGGRGTPGEGWPFYRLDRGGSGRMGASSQSTVPGSFVEEGSFICYPNPATGSSITVRVSVSAQAVVIIRILNLEGERVTEIKRAHTWSQGSLVPFEEAIPTSGMASGIYICSLEVTGNGQSWKGVRKFAVIK